MSDLQEPAPPESPATAAPPPAPTSWVAPEATAGPGPGIEFGGPGPRLVGYIVDTLIVLAAVFAIVVVFGLLAVVVPAIGALGLIVGVVVVPLAYFPYFWAKSGQTPGMKIVNIKVVSDKDGGPVTMGQAILRLIGFWVSGLVFYLGYIWIFIDKRQRGWFDLIAGTVVIKA
jgi:uncharacterized RDD family membrane protein YckC